MKILLWKIGALGDVVMTTPLVRQLRRAVPKASLHYLVGQSFRYVLEDNPYLDRLLVFDESILIQRQVYRLPEIMRLMAGYDMVFVLDKHWIFSLLPALSRIPRRIGFRRLAHEAWLLTEAVPYGEVRHEIDYYLDLLEVAGWPVDRTDIRLDVPRAVDAPAPSGATVLINSGGMNPNEATQVRRLPDTLFATLVEACSKDGPVVFLGASAERAYYDRFASPRTDNICGKTSLPQALSVLAKAERIITTDTGLMHLAGAVNSQVTAVFGPTHPMRKCPPQARWVWRDADSYDARYEVFGQAPRGSWFDSVTARDILNSRQVSALGERLKGLA